MWRATPQAQRGGDRRGGELPQPTRAGRGRLSPSCKNILRHLHQSRRIVRLSHAPLSARLGATYGAKGVVVCLRLCSGSSYPHLPAGSIPAASTTFAQTRNSARHLEGCFVTLFCGPAAHASSYPPLPHGCTLLMEWTRSVTRVGRFRFGENQLTVLIWHCEGGRRLSYTS